MSDSTAITAVFDFIVLCLAGSAIIRAWLHDGTDGQSGLFSDLRDRIELLGGQGDSCRKIASLLQCAYCLSYHVAFWLVLIYFTVRDSTGLVAVFCRFAALVFACARVIQFLQGVNSISGNEKGSDGRSPTL